MKHSRGFTLIELGLVVTVIAVLLSAAVAAQRGFVREARSRRAGEEMATIAQSAAVALRRGINAAGNYDDNVGAPQALGPGPNVGPCYDLSSLTATPVGWPGSQAANPGGHLANVLGGARVAASAGLNPWGQPYVACIFQNRTEVRTCVPPGLLGSTGLRSASPIPPPAPACVPPTFQAVLMWHPVSTRVNTTQSFSYSNFDHVLPGFVPQWNAMVAGDVPD